MQRHYWAVMYADTAWKEFIKNGARVIGFSELRLIFVEKIHPRDYLICFLANGKRLAGVLEVRAECYMDTATIGEEENPPCRLKVKLLHHLMPDQAIPIKWLWDKPHFKKTYWGPFYRIEFPSLLYDEDGKLITKEIEKASRIHSSWNRGQTTHRYRKSNSKTSR